MLRSLRAQLAAILLGYLLLMGGSVTATGLALRAQADDATLINLAGRQRMLTQKMTWLALARPDDPELDAAIRLFDETLRALRDGGPAVDPAGRPVIPPLAPDPTLRAQIEAAAATWTAFRSALRPVEAAAPQGDRSLVLAASSGDAKVPVALRQSLLHEPVRRVIGGGETVVAEPGCFQCVFLQGHPLGQCAAAPLRAGDATLGAMCVVRDAAHPFDSDETRPQTLPANSAAIAIANARLAEAGRHQAEVTAALAERERLAADRHDHLAQTLSYLRLKSERIAERIAAEEPVQAAAELERVELAIDEAYGQVRAALTGLRESTLAADDQAEKLEGCVSEFREASRLPAELVVADATALALPRAVQTQVVHIVREALANIRRHARASRARIRVDRANGTARFTVEDDGCGFDPQSVPAEDHLGLEIIRTRAERSGGSLTVESASGEGTRVVAVFPLET